MYKLISTPTLHLFTYLVNDFVILRANHRGNIVKVNLGGEKARCPAWRDFFAERLGQKIPLGIFMVGTFTIFSRRFTFDGYFFKLDATALTTLGSNKEAIIFSAVGFLIMPAIFFATVICISSVISFIS